MQILKHNEIKEEGFYWVKSDKAPERIVEVGIIQCFKDGKFTHNEPAVSGLRLWAFGLNSQWIGPLKSPF